jgi:hypothetical protein
MRSARPRQIGDDEGDPRAKLAGCAYNLGNFMRTLAMRSSVPSSRWDRQFESGFLHRRVSCEPVSAGARHFRASLNSPRRAGARYESILGRAAVQSCVPARRQGHTLIASSSFRAIGRLGRQHRAPAFTQIRALCRPELDAKMAVRQVLWHITQRGRREVVDADLRDYLERTA